MMINSIEEYLLELKKELAGCDRATVQDALADAEEYLRNALENTRETKPGISEIESLLSIIEEYGTPREIAAAYKRIEKRISPSLINSIHRDKRSLASRFFGVITDPRAWGALLYLLFAFITGIIYFTWAITGISLSFSLFILVIGIPFFGIFMLSIRGIALIEGRLVEALLGIRMPRRPLFSSQNPGIWGRFKILITDRYTWYTLMYMILQLPLGIIYFTVFLILLFVSLWLIAQPILELGLGIPLFTTSIAYYIPVWLMPLSVIGGILLTVLTMHLVKIIGKAHGNLAKAMLVRE
jgi:hypothetical protein